MNARDYARHGRKTPRCVKKEGEGNYRGNKSNKLVDDGERAVLTRCFRIRRAIRDLFSNRGRIEKFMARLIACVATESTGRK